MNSKLVKVASFAAASVVAVWLALLFTGTGVLVSQTKVEPGQRYLVKGFGDVGDAKHACLVGRYFNGRGIESRVFWYSPNGILGKSACPFLLRD